MSRFIVVLVGVACLLGCQTGPPVQEMSDARQAIVAAAAAGATRGSSPEYDAAQAAIARAEAHLQAQEYARARLAAMQAKHHAAGGARQRPARRSGRSRSSLAAAIDMDEVDPALSGDRQGAGRVFSGTARGSRPSDSGVRGLARNLP